ncbi:MAG: hypothetical protein Q9M16_05920 [Mariprofundus sp.]|nr:hypothetical protein [Mariprofundus sp.]
MHKMYHTHALSRLLLAAALLLLVIMTQSTAWYVLLMVASIFMLRLLDGHWLTSIRLLRLMRWFLIPILLLHALLSPGQLLWPELVAFITKEGLMQGLRLSLHLAAVFFVAMLIFRLLRRAEWLYYILLIPYIGQRLAVYVWMMHSMKINIMLLLVDLRMQFRLRKDLKCSALLLMSAFQQTLTNAGDHAAVLWLRWPDALAPPLVDETGRSSVQYYLMSVLLVLLAWGLFVQVFL